MTRTRKAELALAGVTVLWGSTFTIVKSALEDCSTLAFLAMRFSLAVLVLVALWRTRLAREWNSVSVRAGLIAGTCLATGYVLQTAGLRYTTASKSAFLTSLFIVVVPLLGALVYRSVPSWREWSGVILAFLGMGMMVRLNDVTRLNAGDLMTVGCAVAYAGQVLVIDRWARHASARILTLVQLSVVAAATLSTFWLVQPVSIRFTPRLAGAIVVTGVLCTSLAFALQSWAQRYTTATEASLLFSLEPVVAAVTSYLVLGEILPWLGIAGAALILAGVLVVEWKRTSPIEHP